MAQPTAIVTTRGNCPFCNSSARREIDLLIHARHFYDPSNEDAPERIISETGEFVDLTETAPNDTYEQTLDEIKVLLGKLPNHNTKDFDLTDLIIHATNHTVISDVRNQEIRSEGKYLFAGKVAYQSPDLKDYLRLIIAEGARQLIDGEVKVQPKMGIEAAIALWRMTGDAGADGMVDVMRDMVQKGHIGAETPLGKAFAERQAKLNAKSNPEPADADMTDAKIQSG